MISAFSVRPVAKNNGARTLFFALLGAAAASLAVSYFAPLYKGIIQLLSLLLLVGAVMIYTRYVGAFYLYEVAFDSEETPIFVVIQVSGKRRSALCRVDLADIADIKQLSSEEYRAYKTELGMKRYNYTPTLHPSEVYLMQVRSRTERADVFLEISEECRKTILSYAAEAKSLRVAEDDEY